jgi:hypothetical protein
MPNLGKIMGRPYPHNDPTLPQRCAGCGSDFYIREGEMEGEAAAASVLIWRDGTPFPGCTACAPTGSAAHKMSVADAAYERELCRVYGWSGIRDARYLASHADPAVQAAAEAYRAAVLAWQASSPIHV